MRVLIAATVLVLGAASACAADLPVDRSAGYATRSFGHGERSGQIVLYDFQPGVVVRAYWQQPWRNRHYFPHTGQMPEIGRDEDLSAPSEPSEPAQSYRRRWSTSSAFISEQPRQRLPQNEPPQDSAPLK